MSEIAVKERRGGELAGNLDTSFLKVLALCFMFIDHLGAAVLPRVGELRMIGRMALPLYAWCLVVGSVKTHNALRYALRLLGLAVLSQPLYMMALNHTWTDLNILFLLFIAQVALQGIRTRFMGSQIWVPALCYVLLGFVQVAHLYSDPLHGARVQRRTGRRLPGLCAFLGQQLFAGEQPVRLSAGFPVLEGAGTRSVGLLPAAGHDLAVAAADSLPHKDGSPAAGKAGILAVSHPSDRADPDPADDGHRVCNVGQRFLMASSFIPGIERTEFG